MAVPARVRGIGLLPGLLPGAVVVPSFQAAPVAALASYAAMGVAPAAPSFSAHVPVAVPTPAPAMLLPGVTAVAAPSFASPYAPGLLLANANSGVNKMRNAVQDAQTYTAPCTGGLAVMSDGTTRGRAECVGVPLGMSPGQMVNPTTFAANAAGVPVAAAPSFAPVAAAAVPAAPTFAGFPSSGADAMAPPIQSSFLGPDAASDVPATQQVIARPPVGATAPMTTTTKVAVAGGVVGLGALLWWLL